MKKLITLLLLLIPLFGISQNIELDEKTFILQTEDFTSTKEYMSFNQQTLTTDYYYFINIDTTNNEIMIYRKNLLNEESNTLNFAITNTVDDSFNITYRLYDNTQQTEGFLMLSGGDMIIVGFRVSETEKFVGFMGYIENIL
tara:strand:- start:170 stop:595 length:426 start_codon:yes stop_codon:yes gene_type:complete